jgi:hypothetical protein
MTTETLTDYSGGFVAVLDERGALAWKMNACFILTAVVLAFVAWRIQRFLLALPLPVIGAVVSAFIAGALFQDWWDRAQQAAMNDADRQWIADHDGGGLAVAVGILVKALLCLAAISLAILIASDRRASTRRSATHRS